MHDWSIPTDVTEKGLREMHIMVVNFQLKGITEGEFRKLCDEVAPAFASVPGLASKVWLADAATNTYGGIYTWRNRQTMEAFMKSELFQEVGRNPNLAGITVRDFGVLEGPTRVTHGLATVAA